MNDTAAPNLLSLSRGARVVVVLLVLVVAGFAARLNPVHAQQRAPLPSSSASPGEIALALHNRRGADRISYAAQFRSAQLAFEAGDYRTVEETLRRLSAQTFLNSQAIELMYRTQRARGEDSTALRTLNEGLNTYPHAVRLLRLQGEDGLANGSLANPADIAQAYPSSGVRAELMALYAFRQNDFATGLLEAERAGYLYESGNSLGSVTQQAVMSAYANLLEQAQPAEIFAAEELSGLVTTKSGAYARCLHEAATRLATSGLDSLGALRYLAKLRAVALRNYASRGYLAAFPDPLLTDLYVLDRAGHLETATLVQLAWIAPAEMLRYEQTHPREVLQARAYMAEDWRREADAYLKIGQ